MKKPVTSFNIFTLLNNIYHPNAALNGGRFIFRPSAACSALGTQAPKTPTASPALKADKALKSHTPAAYQASQAYRASQAAKAAKAEGLIPSPGSAPMFRPYRQSRQSPLNTPSLKQPKTPKLSVYTPYPIPTPTPISKTPNNPIFRLLKAPYKIFKNSKLFSLKTTLVFRLFSPKLTPHLRHYKPKLTPIFRHRSQP